MSIRIQLSQATVKALQTRLQQAYQKDDVRLVRRIHVLLDILVRHTPVEGLHERWGVSPSCISRCGGKMPGFVKVGRSAECFAC